MENSIISTGNGVKSEFKKGRTPPAIANINTVTIIIAFVLGTGRQKPKLFQVHFFANLKYNIGSKIYGIAVIEINSSNTPGVGSPVIFGQSEKR